MRQSAFGRTIACKVVVNTKRIPILNTQRLLGGLPTKLSVNLVASPLYEYSIELAGVFCIASTRNRNCVETKLSLILCLALAMYRLKRSHSFSDKHARAYKAAA